MGEGQAGRGWGRRRAHLLLLHADPEVGLVELVGYVPAESSKLPPLLHQSVEEAEAEEQLAPGLGLVAALKEARIGDGVIEVGAEEVGSEALWRLIGHLDTCRERVASGHVHGTLRGRGLPFCRMETGKCSEG